VTDPRIRLISKGKANASAVDGGTHREATRHHRSLLSGNPDVEKNKSSAVAATTQRLWTVAFLGQSLIEVEENKTSL
jgi:hypothetical protein